MTERQLAVREATAIVQGFDDPTRELIRKSVGDPKNPLSTDEFELFIAVCQHTGLNPLLKEIYATKMDGRFTILTGIDGHRRIAQASPRFRGMAGPFYCGPDGKWADVWLEATPPVACKVGVYLPGRQDPTWGIAYYKNYKNRRTPTWTQMPEHMLAIRAESFALRKCFSRELGGVALPADDEQWDTSVDVEDAPDPGPSPRMAALRAEMDAAVADDATTDIVDPDQVEGWDAVTQHEQEQPPTADALAQKRAEALALAARCREAGARTADPHPQATEVALDDYIGRHRRLLNARAARP